MPPQYPIGRDGDDNSSIEETNTDYELSASSLSLSNETKKPLHASDQWIISVKDEQFPPNVDWIKDFESNPDEPFKKSYRAGIPLIEVDPNAPKIRVGITFLEGRDRPSVAQAEMSKVSYREPPQQTPQWRVFTAATLLKRFDVGSDLSINRRDDSHNILEDRKERMKMLKSPTSPDRNRQIPQRVLTRTPSEEDNSKAVIKRNIQDHTLTIDSDQVKLIHGTNSTDQEFDITCTLVEIDMFSMRDLMRNYRTIIQSGKRNMTSKDTIQILDTMINDVRCLCTRSPRLFRMGTRSAIAQSKRTMYGVDYTSLFATLTTSEGIRKIVEKSSAFYLSLNENKSDQDSIRPKFLQMLVLLLSLLNNDDLSKIRKVLEDTFRIPGDRSNLELLIMKVLPLGSINPSVFLEDLWDAYRPFDKLPRDFEESMHPAIWKDLQIDLAVKGYVVPVPTEIYGMTSLNSGNSGIEDDLEAMFNSANNNSEPPRFAREQPQTFKQEPTSHRGMSWFASWPRDGVNMSTVFKYLQHDGNQRDGNSKQGTVRAINEIPHLEITAEDGRDNTILAWFTNKVQYRISARDPETISSMEKGQYVLRAVDNETVSNLEIDDDILNEPFIEATTHLNGLLKDIRYYFGGKDHKRRSGLSVASVFSSNKPSVTSFTPINEPTEATKVRADVVSPSGERTCCAVAFKIGNRVVYRDDILREMSSTLSQLKNAVERMDKEVERFLPKRVIDEASRLQKAQVAKLNDTLNKVKAFMEDARIKRGEVQGIRREYPEDPITRVIYPSVIQTTGEKPEWQDYKTQLKTDGARLFVLSKKLTVESVSPGDDHIVKLTFAGCAFTLSVEPLTSGTPSDISPKVSPRSIVLWVGYYLVVVAASETQEHSVLGYCRVISQKRGPESKRRVSGVQHMKSVLSVLV
jgi:hypothetical protein